MEIVVSGGSTKCCDGDYLLVQIVLLAGVEVFVRGSVVLEPSLFVLRPVPISVLKKKICLCFVRSISVVTECFSIQYIFQWTLSEQAWLKEMQGDGFRQRYFEEICYISGVRMYVYV